MESVIFLTAENDSEPETNCFRAGAVDFIGKPFIPDVLCSRVKRTLENLIESRDGSTGMHVKNTQQYVCLLVHQERCYKPAIRPIQNYYRN